MATAKTIATIKSVKKNDTVTVIAGKFKGRTGTVVGVDTKARTVQVDGIGLVTRHVKRSQFNPQGGDRSVHVGLDVSKVKKTAAAKPAAKPAKTTKESK